MFEREACHSLHSQKRPLAGRVSPEQCSRVGSLIIKMAKKTILVVEDMPSEREVVAQALGLMGFRVLTAENGRIALDIYHRRKVDLILSDVNMPEMDGFDLLRTLREEGSDTPLVLLTGMDEGAVKAATVKNPATGVLVKPFRLNHLREEFGRIFGEPASSQ